MDMGFFDRPTPRRTQRPRPFLYKQSIRRGGEEIGLRYDVREPQGLLPSGNNLYAILLRDIQTYGVTIQMYGYIRGAELLGGDSPDYYEPHFDDDPEDETTEPIWFSRNVRREAALDYMQYFARGAGSQEEFLHELGQLTGYDIAYVQTIRVIPLP